MYLADSRSSAQVNIAEWSYRLIVNVWSLLSERCLPVLVITAPQREIDWAVLETVRGQGGTKKSVGLRKRGRCLSRPCPNLANCSLRHDHKKCLCHIEREVDGQELRSYHLPY